MTTKPTPKQSAVVTSLASGQTVQQAMDAAGVSQSYENRATFLMRLVDNGLVVVLPTGT